jgi:hemerythrin-like domain-containing protein
MSSMAKKGTKKAKTTKTTKTTKKVTKKPARKKAPARPVRTAVKGALAGAVAVITKRLPGDPDAIALLEADHRRLEDLLKQGEDTTERAVKGRRELLKTLTAQLRVHELIEEKILYPALKAHPEARDIVLEGFQEHHVADLLVKELHDVSKSAEEWGPKFKVLKENIEHHIQEEEGPMFRTARGVFSREELQAMGAKMKKMKAQASSRPVQ